MPPFTFELFFSSLALAATSLSSRAVVWLPYLHRQRWIPWLQAVAVGLLLGDALLHVLPHALEHGGASGDILMVTALGIIVLLYLESTMRSALRGQPTGMPAARTMLVGDLVHHAVDGMILAGAFAAGPGPGYAALAAIALHEVPREMSNAGALVALGYTPGRAFVLSVLMALIVPVAAMGMGFFAPGAGAMTKVSAFAGGTILYIALADILPGVWPNTVKKSRMAPAIGAMAGLLFMVLLAKGEHH